MAIIINEFEIVAPPTTPREQPPRETRATQPDQSPQPPRPEDIERIVRRFARRRLRLWAD
jgi:hypothetical protein